MTSPVNFLQSNKQNIFIFLMMLFCKQTRYIYITFTLYYTFISKSKFYLGKNRNRLNIAHRKVQGYRCTKLIIMLN